MQISLLVFSLVFHCSLSAVLEKVLKSRIHDIHWNSNNPSFEVDPYWRLRVLSRDSLRFHCPQAPEVLLIYKVKKPCFESCFIGDESELIVNCSSSFAHFSHLKIHSTKTVKVDFEEEERDSTLYFLTTSTGEFDGLDNEIFGLCHERNLRISVEVQRKDRLHNRHRHHSGLHWREENGVGSWKKNVFHRKALEPFESREVEEEPIEDERVNRIQNVMSGQMHLMPPDVRQLPDDSLRLPSVLLNKLESSRSLVHFSLVSFIFLLIRLV